MLDKVEARLRTGVDGSQRFGDQNEAKRSPRHSNCTSPRRARDSLCSTLDHLSRFLVNKNCAFEMECLYLYVHMFKSVSRVVTQFMRVMLSHRRLLNINSNCVTALLRETIRLRARAFSARARSLDWRKQVDWRKQLECACAEAVRMQTVREAHRESNFVYCFQSLLLAIVPKYFYWGALAGTYRNRPQ